MHSRAVGDSYTKKTLPNGLTVLLKQDKSNPVVATNIWFRIGSAHETDDMSGLAHFQEHMVFKGTQRHGVGEIANIVKSAGGNLNAATSYSYTMYYVVLPSESFALALDVQADAMMNSTFAPEEFTKERLVVIDEARMYDDTPDAYTYYRTMELGYKKHNYRRPIAGYEKVVSGFTRERLLDFYNAYYRPGNAVLVVVGDVDPDYAMSEIEKTYGLWPGRDVELPDSPVEPPQGQFRFGSMRGEIDHAYLGFGFHTTSILDRDYPALEVLVTLLGSGKSSRLRRRVLEDKRLVTSVSASLLAEKWPGYLMVFASTPPDKWEPARDAVYEEIARFTREPVGEDELLKARRQVEKWVYSELETVEGQASNTGYYEVMGDYRLADEHREAIKKVTANDVLEVAGRYLKLNNCSLVAYLPDRSGIAEPDAAEVASMLTAVERSSVESADVKRSGAGAPAVVVGAETAATTEPETQSQAGPVEPHTLDNGVRILVKRRTTVPMVSVLTLYVSGTRFEPKGCSGLSLLTARGLLKGTPTYDDNEIVNRIEGLGGTIESFSGFDLNGVYLNILTEHLDGGLEVYKDVVRHPSFASEKIEQEKHKLSKELAKRHDHPVYFTIDNLFSKTFGDHPYAYPFVGDEAQLASLTGGDCADWYQRVLVPEGTVAVFVGDITTRRALEIAGELFGDLTPGRVSEPETHAPEVPSNPGMHVLARPNLNQAVGLVGFLAPPMMTPESIALRVLDGLMTGLGGRLFVELRDKRSLGYMAGSAFMPLKERSIFYGYSNPQPEGIDEAIEVILSELTKVTKELVTDEEISKSKKWLIGSQTMKLQRNIAQAMEYGFYEALDFGYETVDRFPDRVQGVSKEDIRAAAAAVFDRSKAVCVKLIPE